MIIRTYQRRNRSLNDGSSQESLWSSSQESLWSSSQENQLSSQELINWSSLELNLEDDKPQERKRKTEESSQGGGGESSSSGGRKSRKGGGGSLQRNVGLSLNKRWGFSAPPNSTLMDAQESGEMVEQMDEVNFAMDGLREGQAPEIQEASLISVASLCTSLQQRRFLRSHGIAKTLLDAVVCLPTTTESLALAAATVFYLFAIDGHEASLLDTQACIAFLLKLIGNNYDDNENKPSETIAKITAVFEKLRGGRNGSDVIPAAQLTPKSLALRTLEKACLSAVALDDNSGTVSKVGGKFKERLREQGGLDVICDVAATSFVSLMSKSSTTLEPDVAMLLRCFRVMENVTFLSEENQGYLLRLKHHNKHLPPSSFIELVINSIVALQKFMKTGSWSEAASKEESQKTEAAVQKASPAENSSDSQSKPSSLSGSRGASNQKELKLRSALENARVLNSQRKASLTRNCQKMIQVKVSGRERRFKDPNELSRSSLAPETNGFDPYEFDELDFDIKPPTGKTKRSQGKKAPEPRKSSSSSSSQKFDRTLFEECLLSAVKVLMNLTNDNAAGCKQVAKCNGINSIASLLVSNYPSKTQSEASLDLLVTTLGMLVNLVEKDSNNRSQLATLNVEVPCGVLCREDERGMISLLCSLFLSKKGSGEAAEASSLKIEEEDSVKKGQREAENMIVEAYTALVLAFLSTESEEARQAIAERLPSEGLQALVPVLDRFVAFHLSLNMISTDTHAAVTDVINSLRKPAALLIED